MKTLFMSYPRLISCCVAQTFLACATPPSNFYGKDVASLCKQIRHRDGAAVRDILREEKCLILSHKKDALNALLIARNTFPEITPFLLHYQFEQIQQLLHESKCRLPSVLGACIASYAVGGWGAYKTPTLSPYSSLDWAVIRKDHAEIAAFINDKNNLPIAASCLQTAYMLEDKKACGLLLPHVSSPLLGRLNGHKGSIRSLLFTPTGQLATGSEDGTVKIWDIYKMRCEATFATAAAMISNISHNTQDNRLAVASWYNNAIELWDMHLQQRVQTLQQSDTPIVSLSFCPSRPLLLLGNMAGEARWIDTEKRSCLASKALHQQPVMSLSWRDPQFVATSSMDGSVKLIDFREKIDRITTLKRKEESAVNAVFFLPDTSFLATGGIAQCFSIWDMRNLSNKLYSLDSGSKAVMDFAFCSSKGILACGGSEGSKITTWDPATGKLLRTLGQDEGGIYKIALHPSDNVLAVGGWKAEVGLYGV